MKNKKNYILLAIGVVIVIVLGVLFAASKAFPTNPLYVIRTNVIEKTVSKMKSDDLSRTKYAVDLSEIRLQELTALKAQNALFSEGGNRARENFNLQTIAIQQGVLALQNSKGADESTILQLSEILDVQIEKAKVVFDIDQLEVLPEDAPAPKATSTKTK